MNLRWRTFLTRSLWRRRSDTRLACQRCRLLRQEVNATVQAIRVAPVACTSRSRKRGMGASSSCRGRGLSRRFKRGREPTGELTAASARLPRQLLPAGHPEFVILQAPRCGGSSYPREQNRSPVCKEIYRVFAGAKCNRFKYLDTCCRSGEPPRVLPTSKSV
jgi:hypothetical protein